MKMIKTIKDGKYTLLEINGEQIILDKDIKINSLKDLSLTNIEKEIFNIALTNEEIVDKLNKMENENTELIVDNNGYKGSVDWLEYERNKYKFVAKDYETKNKRLEDDIKSYKRIIDNQINEIIRLEELKNKLCEILDEYGCNNVYERTKDLWI